MPGWLWLKADSMIIWSADCQCDWTCNELIACSVPSAAKKLSAVQAEASEAEVKSHAVGLAV